MKTRPVAFTVTLTPGPYVQVRAHYARVVHGALAFLDEREDLIQAFGPGTWHSVVRKDGS